MLLIVTYKGQILQFLLRETCYGDKTGLELYLPNLTYFRLSWELLGLIPEAEKSWRLQL